MVLKFMEASFEPNDHFSLKKLVLELKGCFHEYQDHDFRIPRIKTNFFEILFRKSEIT